MIGRLFRLSVAAVTYFCVATILSQAIMIGYLVTKKGFDRGRLVQVLAVARGADLIGDKEKPKEASKDDVAEASGDQPSYEQILEARAIKTRNLELREQSLRGNLDQLQREQTRLADANEQFQGTKSRFEAALKAEKEKIDTQGWEENRLAITKLKPKQAKAILLEMLEKNELADVVALLAPLPETQMAKILSEFKTPEETKKVDEILRQIRRGEPLAGVTNQVQQQLSNPTPAGQQGTP